MTIVIEWTRTLKTLWCLVMVMMLVLEVASLSGTNVCMVQQKYNITKRVKYRAPMSVRSYVWCFSIPPRCSLWKTEMRDLTRLETEERNAEVAVCCPGYKMKDISCIPICPNGKTGRDCKEDCPANKWGPNCVHECDKCLNGFCSPQTGKCDCLEGWQGESCQISMSTTPVSTALVEETLTTTKSSVQTLASFIPTESTTESMKSSSSTPTSTPPSMHTSTIATTVKATTSTTTTTTKTIKALTTIAFSTLPSITSTSNNNFNITLPLQSTTWTNDHGKIESTTVSNSTFIYNRTETPGLHPIGTSANFITEHATEAVKKTRMITKIPTSTTRQPSTIATKSLKATIHTITENNDSMTFETRSTKKFTTAKTYPSTIKFKPKEIWIKPTQKGETAHKETKIKSHEAPHTRIKSVLDKNEMPIETTTPKTIIVSIIPTSISHASFKKIALTTVSYIIKKTNATTKFSNKTEGFTKAIDHKTSTALPFTIKIVSSIKEKKHNISEPNRSTVKYDESETKSIPTLKKNLKEHTYQTSKFNTSITKTLVGSTMATSQTTNSMSTMNEVSSLKLNLSTLLTKKPSTNNKTRNFLLELTTATTVKRPILSNNISSHKTHNTNKYTRNMEITKLIPTMGTTKIPVIVNANTTYNTTKRFANTFTTLEPVEDETFHILTEPEHITAVMNDKEREHTSVDLISVISIAGAVVMAVITVAVIIVMMERCKRPRYDNVSKMNEMRMHSMIDSDEEPPPYVRSILHTPLPEPPIDKCHYQPITTLDRNLKQFMRPVVVQTISPVMLENFREILECHYDHLPRRHHDLEVPIRSSASSMKYDGELHQLRPLSVADTIEALKCEAKFDVIDNTTSEPLYAEIPCWRPQSEHAIEVLNLNGEAVTEL